MFHRNHQAFPWRSSLLVSRKRSNCPREFLHVPGRKQKKKARVCHKYVSILQKIKMLKQMLICVDRLAYFPIKHKLQKIYVTTDKKKQSIWDAFLIKQSQDDLYESPPFLLIQRAMNKLKSDDSSSQTYCHSFGDTFLLLSLILTTCPPTSMLQLKWHWDVVNAEQRGSGGAGAVQIFKSFQA